MKPTKTNEAIQSELKRAMALDNQAAIDALMVVGKAFMEDMEDFKIQIKGLSFTQTNTQPTWKA